MPPAILRDVSTELRSPRLLLRAPRAGDGVAVHEAVVETLSVLRAWPASLPWAMAEPSVAASEVFCRESEAAFIRRTALVYLVFDEADRFVASTSLHGIDWSVPRFELGYWCRSSRHRQGLMTEAISCLLDYAFASLGARRVYAGTDEQNHPSRALCEAVGMQLEGILRNDRITPAGELRNSCSYARIA